MRRKLPSTGGSVVLETEAHLHADLEVLDVAVLDLAAHLGDLEPVDVTQGAGRSGDAVPDGLVDALAQAAFMTMAVLTKVAADNDLSLTQLRVLAILRDRRLRMTALADYLGLEKSTMTGLVNRAEKRGLRRLRLCTQPAMRAAQHLYAATGFSRTPELDFEPVPGLTLRAFELALPVGP